MVCDGDSGSTPDLTLYDHSPLTSAGFARVKEGGRSLAGRQLVINWLPAPDGRTRLGLVVGRRFSPKAVVRNRARRLIRETFRLLRHEIEHPVWIVIIARAYLRGARQPEVQAEYSRVLARAGLLHPEPAP